MDTNVSGEEFSSADELSSVSPVKGLLGRPWAFGGEFSEYLTGSCPLYQLYQ